MSTPDDGFVSLFAMEAAARPQRIFARFDGSPITFGQLDRVSDAVAAGLRRLDVRAGDRVAVMMRNSPATLAVLFGLAKAGAVWVPVNVQQRGSGLRYVLDHCEPALVVCDGDLVAVLRQCGAVMDPARTIVHGGGDGPGLEDILGSGGSFGEPPPTADAVFAIMYTSGTTGPPKGVLVSHAMMRLAGEGVTLVTEPRPGDVMFVWEPLYHIGGAQLLVLPLLRDASLAFVERFSASRFWHEVKRAEATHIHYLGGILQILLKQDASPADRDHRVRTAWGAGCPKGLWRDLEVRFGFRIRECYGMTEASSITTFNERGVVGSVGRAVPWFSVSVLDGDGHEVAPGERGEIVVRNPRSDAIFPGYFRNPEASARALRDGALHTGDLGSFDADLNLVFEGRLTDSLRVKGENVSAWQVEHVAAEHPAVEDCAVVGVEAEIGEQDIKLFVKPRAGVTLDLPAMAAWLAERLAPFQVPRYIALVEEFERTPSQRIIKRLLPTRLDDCWDRSRSDPAGKRVDVETSIRSERELNQGSPDAMPA